MLANQISNSVLSAFLHKTADSIGSRLLTRPIRAGEVLFEPGAPYIHAIFPHSGLISLQAILSDGRTVEKSMVGRDEFVGIEYALGDTHICHQGVVALSGRASWLPISDLNTVLEHNESIKQLVRRSGMSLIRGLEQSVICASVHSASQRLATWLLRAADRSETDQLELTQRSLANIFGLRLATISDACAKLQSIQAIKQRRSILTIVDRDKLEVQACECYAQWRALGASIGLA